MASWKFKLHKPSSTVLVWQGEVAEPGSGLHRVVHLWIGQMDPREPGCETSVSRKQQMSMGAFLAPPCDSTCTSCNSF